MILGAEQLHPIQQLYERGQLLEAFEASKALGPLQTWRGPEGRVLAGRLAMNLGAPRMGHLLHFIAAREHPEHPLAIYYAGLTIANAFGPLRGWEFCERHGDLAVADAELQADWFALRGVIAASVRDFQTAESWMKRAEALAPDKPWILVERAYVLERQDRYEDALASARRALEVRPWHRPAVQSVANLLQLLDRDDQALELLTEASQRLQSGPIMANLAAIQTELRLYEPARQSWERMEALSPMLEKTYAQWLNAHRSDAAYYCGDLPAAISFAKNSKNPFHEGMATKLEEVLARGDSDQRRRVLLPVGFVRQHHMTCAPATLSALSRFWNMPVEHLSLAESICYDGTPAHSERSWAEQNGYVAREFTVNWDIAVALIDRGIPFTLTTVEPTNAHLQSVIGYDALRGSLLIRDPFQRNFGEFLIEPLLKRYASSGPRGMVMVPKSQAHLLDGISLPDADQYDALNEIQRALVAYQRDAAQAAFDAMNAKWPDERLTLQARRSLASYDADAPTHLQCVEQLLTKFSEDQPLELARLSLLRTMSRRDERLKRLNEIIARKDTDPIFRIMLAQEQSDDARQNARTERLLRGALRRRPHDAGAYSSLAAILWESQRRDQALTLYRWAMCLEDKAEGFARAYFIASRHVKQTDQTLQQMRDRFERFGAQSGWPVRTLAWAYEEISQTDKAFKSLEQGLQKRLADGELMLHVADAHARYGRFDQAAKLVEAAKGKAPEGAWLRTAAEIAGYRGELNEAKALWQKLAALQPLDYGAHRQLAWLLAQTESHGAAVEYLRGVVERFPQHYPLNQLWIEWLREEPTAAEPVIRRLIDIHPADSWSRRELVDCLINQRRHEEALAEAQAAVALDPAEPPSHFYVARALSQLGRAEEARASYRRAIELSVDFDFAIHGLIETCESIAQRKEALAFVQHELVRQTIFGDGLLTYRQHAREVLDPQELLASLQEALAARPDLWHAHSAVVLQLIDMDRLAEAEAAAKETAALYPLLPIVWIDYSMVCRLKGDIEGERAMLDEALKINPGWARPARLLAESYERSGEFQKCKTTLEQAVTRSPLDPALHGALADAMWKLNERDAAIGRLKHALRLEPGYEWGWQTLHQWASQLNRPDEAVEMARELTVRRAGEARSWMILTRLLDGKLDEQLAALDKALELNPRLHDAMDLRARLLAQAGRFDEALQACRLPLPPDSPPSTPPPVAPLELRARAAWIAAIRGDVDSAITQMRALVAEDPGFFGGWSQLCDWLREKNVTEYLAVAETMVDRWPHSPVTLGYLGDAKKLNNDRSGAKAAFVRAIRVSPDYLYGAATLFDMQLEDGQLDAAGATLDIIGQHGDVNDATARTVQLACRLGDREGAREGVVRLCTSPAQQWALDRAIGAMDANHWADDVEAILRHAIERDDVNPAVGTVWLQRLVKAERWRNVEQTLNRLLEMNRGIAPGTLANNAIRASIFEVMFGGQSKVVRRIIARHRDLLRTDADMWGFFGAVLLDMGESKQTIEWLADWETRQGAQPWMLSNLVTAYFRINRIDDARPVSEFACRLPPDDTTGRLEILAAFNEAALACATHTTAGADSARRRLQRADAQSREQGMYPYLVSLTQSLIQIASTDLAPGALHAAAEEARQAGERYPQYKTEVEPRAAHWHYLQSLRRRVGFVALPTWCKLRLLNPPIFRTKNRPTPTRAAVPQTSSPTIWPWVIAAIIIARLLMSLASR